MTIKVLAVAEFDCAGVGLRHRAVLRARGIDYRIAVHDIYRHEGHGADWYLKSRIKDCDLASLRRFAEEADVLQFHPVIGQPWSCIEGEFYDGPDAAEVLFGSIDWTKEPFRSKRRVAFFHGSRLAAQHVERYGDKYRRAGYELLASTLDYVFWLSATYTPAVLSIVAQPDHLRSENDEFYVGHTPTDPKNCHTDLFIRLCSELKIRHQVITGEPPEAIIEMKPWFHAGFDHLRGAFSVNTLENAALGLVPLVALKTKYEKYVQDEVPWGVQWPFPPVFGEDGLRAILIDLCDDPELTRSYQRYAKKWYWKDYQPWAWDRLEAIYRRLAS